MCEPTGFSQETVSSGGRDPSTAVCRDFPRPVSFQHPEPGVQDGGTGGLCDHTEHPHAARADPSQGRGCTSLLSTQHLKLDLVRVDEHVVGVGRGFRHSLLSPHSFL